MANLPTGHILIDGQEYVMASLFNALTKHCLEMGLAQQQAVQATNRVHQRGKEAQALADSRGDELERLRAELEQCREKLEQYKTGRTA